MPFPLRKRREAAITYVMDKMKHKKYGSGKMKDDNYESHDDMYAHRGDQTDYSTGYRMAVDELMEAASSKDAQSFEKALKGFVSMMLDESMDKHNQMYHESEMKEYMGDKKEE